MPAGGSNRAKLLSIANMSLDGYLEGPDGSISWGEPDEEYFTRINEIQRSVATYLYGRRMYEAMVYWETASLEDVPRWVADFTTAWREADKVVFSRSLTAVSSAHTTLEHAFDRDGVRARTAVATGDLTVGGADLAAQAFGAGLVDECHLFVWPVVLGGGKPALPRDARYDLELLDEHRLRSGVVHVHYRVAR